MQNRPHHLNLSRSSRGNFVRVADLDTSAVPDGLGHGVTQFLPEATSLRAVFGGDVGVSAKFPIDAIFWVAKSTAACNVSVLR